MSNPVEPIHDADCEEWCNHCAICGVGVLWGKRCAKHRGYYPPAPVPPSGDTP